MRNKSSGIRRTYQAQPKDVHRPYRRSFRAEEIMTKIRSGGKSRPYPIDLQARVQ